MGCGGGQRTTVTPTCLDAGGSPAHLCMTPSTALGLRTTASSRGQSNAPRTPSALPVDGGSGLGGGGGGTWTGIEAPCNQMQREAAAQHGTGMLSEGKAPQRWPQKRLDRRLEEGVKAVGGG